MLCRPVRSRRPSRTLLFLSAVALTTTALLLPASAVSAAPSADRDHDKMSDRWERAHGLKVGVDDRFRDPDRDRLVNVVEFRRGTNPRRADTDKDGLRDDREVRHFRTDPRKADTDGDGLSDAHEIRRSKTDPRKADTDGDGLSDGREINGTRTNPRVADSDGDGVNDGNEVAGGTDPNVRNAPGGTTPPGPGVPDQFTGLIQKLRSMGLDQAQVQAVVDRIDTALAGGQLSPQALNSLLEPIVEAFSDAGLPADQVSHAVLQVLEALSASELPSDPNGMINLLLDTVQDALVGTPLNVLNPILEQIQNALEGILAGPPSP